MLVDTDDPSRWPPAIDVVGGADRGRRRGHGRQAAGQPHADADGAWSQPGIKVRGREYLRIIYGPDYTEPENLDRLRDRTSATSARWRCASTRSGLEALDRLARGEPLWRVHEAVFAVLALESEPVDPRL